MWDRRIKVSVADDYNCLVNEDQRGDNPYSIQVVDRIPGWQKYGQLADIVALNAPTPLLLIFAEHGIWLTISHQPFYTNGLERILCKYSAFKAEQDFEVFIGQGVHSDLNLPGRADRAIQFLDKFLRA